MNSRRQQLCERIAEVHAQASSIPRRRYGAALERDIADYAMERSAEGASQEMIAAELGLSLVVLGKWIRHARLRQARVQVHRVNHRGFVFGSLPPRLERRPVCLRS